MTDTIQALTVEQWTRILLAEGQPVACAGCEDCAEAEGEGK